MLTQNFYQEAPSWSPNGRVLIFYRETAGGNKGQGASANLWAVDITGYNEVKIKTPIKSNKELRIYSNRKVFFNTVR